MSYAGIGLLGSDQYVASLSQAQRDRIRLYLNFDMVASPNYAYKLYDGDDSNATGPLATPSICVSFPTAPP